MKRGRDLDAAAAAVLGPQLDGAEPANVLGAEEHPAHKRLLLVHLDRVARQHHLLYHEPVWVAAAQRACTCSRHSPLFI